MTNINEFLSIINNLSLSLFVLFVGVFLLVFKFCISLLSKLKFVSFLASSLEEDRWFGQMVGSLFVISLALVADNWTVYLIAVVVIATLVTKMEFLLWVLTLIGNRVELARTMIGSQEQKESQEESKLPAIDVDKVIQLSEKFLEQSKQLEEAENNKQFMILTEFFYDTYARIFGSQVEMLKMIESVQNHQVNKEMLESFYLSTNWKNTYPFPNYIGFLLARKMLEYNPITNTYSTTDVARIFLNFIQTKKLPIKQPF